jgi:hypothetical protein
MAVIELLAIGAAGLLALNMGRGKSAAKGAAPSPDAVKVVATPVDATGAIKTTLDTPGAVAQVVQVVEVAQVVPVYETAAALPTPTAAELAAEFERSELERRGREAAIVWAAAEADKARRLELKQIEDDRIRKENERRDQERIAADAARAVKVAAEQAAFILLEQQEQARLLALDLARIAEMEARKSVIEPYGKLIVQPNQSIGGATDLMDVTWGFRYVSGPDNLFTTMRITYRGDRQDMRSPSVTRPGENRTFRHRIGTGIYRPGTHSITVELISSATSGDDWTVHASETVSFTIPEPPFHAKTFEQMGNELGWAVYRQGMGRNAYSGAWKAWFSGNNQRVTDLWISQWYAGAQVGKLGKKMRPGQLGADRQPGLRSP